jgi:hypothetical protein
MRSKPRAAALIVGLSSALCGLFTTPALAQADAQSIDAEPVPERQLPVPAAPAAPAWPRQVAVEGQAGYGAPLGDLGLAVEADVLPWLSLSAGLGSDLFESQYQPLYVKQVVVRQMALMPRLRFPVFDDATFVTLGAGVSRDAGPHTQTDDHVLVRQDNELGLEHRFGNGVRVRAFAGIGVALNDPTHPGFAPSAYAGAAFGYALYPNPESSAVPKGSWYGWQPLMSDLLAAAVAASGNGTHESARAGLAIFAVTPSVIHFAHRNYGRAMASAFLRMGLLYMAANINDGSPGSDYDVRGPGPFVAAAVIAALVDDLAMSWG